MSSVQQRNEPVVTDDLELTYAELGSSPNELSTALDLEGVETFDSEIDAVIKAERLKIPSPESKINTEERTNRSVQHPIAHAAAKATQRVNEKPENTTNTEPILNSPPSTTPNIIKEGKLRVTKPQPQTVQPQTVQPQTVQPQIVQPQIVQPQVVPAVESKITNEVTREPARQNEQISAESKPQVIPVPTQVISPEAPAIPAHLLEKLNLPNPQQPQVETELTTKTETQPSVMLSEEQPELLQVERPRLTIEQAMKLDLSLAKIGTGQKIKPISFRGHKLSSGTLLDRLITALADIIKRFEMRLTSFLTRKRAERKAVKVILPKEGDDGLHLASFSNSLSRSRKKRNRWLERFKIARR